MCICGDQGKQKQWAGFKTDEVRIQGRCLESIYPRTWHPKQESEPRMAPATGWKDPVCDLGHTDIDNCQQCSFSGVF
jgi:hypothetical protein